MIEIARLFAITSKISTLLLETTFSRTLKVRRVAIRVNPNPRLLLTIVGVVARTALHKLEALSILHGRLILDRLLVLFIIQSDRLGVKVQHLSQLVGDIRAHLLISAILQPDLEKAFLRPETQRHADNARLLELLTYKGRIKIVELLLIKARRSDSHILLMLSSFLILVIQIPPFGLS